MLATAALMLLRRPKATRRPEAVGTYNLKNSRVFKNADQSNSDLLATVLRRSSLGPDGIAMQTCYVL